MPMDQELRESNFVQNVFELFAQKGKQRILNKGDFLIREGEVERNLYFIEQGAVKVFYLTEYDEHIIRLGYDGSLLNSLSSFLSGKPSNLYIEAIKRTKVQQISKEQLLEVTHRNENSIRAYSAFLETILCQQIDREVDLLTPSPSERLNRVLKRSPKLFQYIPLKYIASYLRMTPETLSRVRKP